MPRNNRHNIKCTSKIRAAEDDFAPEMPIEDVPMDEVPETADGGVDVDDSAYGLLFETEDVAELVAEVTGQEVEVKADDESVVFTIGEDEYTVTPEEDTEVLESVRRPLRGRRRVSASAMAKARRPLARRPMARRPVGASAQLRRPMARRPMVRRPIASATRPTAPIARKPGMANRPMANRPMARRPVGASAQTCRPMPARKPATAACKPTKAATAPVKQGKVIRKAPTTKK